MVRQEFVISVFAASPGDVTEERNKLEEVIRELNVIWSRDLGLRLELVRWETHAFPGIGQDAQDVINTEIPDYDIFIGIMWHRFGTPTGRYGSGTIEEFERAKARSKADPDNIKIMFYFRDSPPISISTIDGNELAKVQNFRQNLGQEGALYWTYTDISDFEKFLRLHLARQVQAWKARAQGPQEANSKEEVEIATDEEDNDDLGILEINEIYEEHFEAIPPIIARIRESIEEFGQKVNLHTAEMNSIQSLSIDPKIARHEAKKQISRLSMDMNQFGERVGVEIPLFKKSMNTGLSAFIRSVEMSIDLSDSPEHRKQMHDSLTSLEEMNVAIDSALSGIRNFRNSTSALPRMTGEISKAKRQLVSVLDNLISELKLGNSLAREAAEAVRDRLRQLDA